MTYVLSFVYYEKTHYRSNVIEYGSYFIGSIVLTGGEKAIIDGQQRFSSLTLLLIFLNNKIKEMGESYSLIDNMIFSEAYGMKSFNITVKDREECLNALYNNLPYDIENKTESIVNLYNSYIYICELFPNSIDKSNLLYFCDWLCEKVFFIEIVATTEQDAHKIFISMNDRGLSLTSTEMLKGYLLSEIKEDEIRERLNSLWKKRILQLKEISKNEDETFIKVWLRSQYADTIRETRAGAVNKDFDIIGGSFHKWVRDEKRKLNLITPKEFENFIEKFNRFVQIYLIIKEAETNYLDKYKHVYYNASLDFTFQSQLIMSSISYEDSNDIVEYKIKLVSEFIDLFIYSRAVNYKSNNYNSIKNYIFTLTKKLRNKSIDNLKIILKESYTELGLSISDNIYRFRINSYTKKYIKHMLARITDYVEEKGGFITKYELYVDTTIKNPYEIEHIIPNHYEWYTSEYSSLDDF